MLKKVLPIVVALILAAIATLGIVNWSRTIATKGKPTEVLVATRELSAGHIINPTDLQPNSIREPLVTKGNASIWRGVFKDFVKPDNIGTLVGGTLVREAKAGEAILESMLKPVQSELHLDDWRTKIPKGKRAITIPVDAKAAVAGLVDVGDHVDILVNINVPPKEESSEKISVPVQMGGAVQTIQVPYSKRNEGEPMTFYLLQDVEILAVGTDTIKEEELNLEDDPLEALKAASRGRTGGVTVALTPEQVLTFVFAISNGASEFTLSLRTPQDRTVLDISETKPATFDTLLETVGAQR